MARVRVFEPDPLSLEWDTLNSQTVGHAAVIYTGAEIPGGKDYSEIEYRYGQNAPPALVAQAITNAVLVDAAQWGYVIQKPDILIPALQQGV